MNMKEITNIIHGAKAEIELDISRSGLPCLWEVGGGWTNTGESQIICDRFGCPKKAIYVRSHGVLCNSNHALIPVVVGDMVVEDDEHRGNHTVYVWEITHIEGEKATLELIEFSRNKKIGQEPVYAGAVAAAMEKSNTYHCRDVFYAQTPHQLHKEIISSVATDEVSEEVREDDFFDEYYLE